MILQVLVKKFFLITCLLLFSQAMLAQEGDSVFYIGGNEDDRGVDIIRGEHGYLLLCSTRSFGASSEDYMILKLSDDGRWNPQYVYGYANQDYPAKFLSTSNGKTHFFGTSWGRGYGRLDVELLTIDDSLNVSTTNHYGDRYDDWGLSSTPTNDNGAVITGHSRSSGVMGDILLYKIDNQGLLLWKKYFGTTAKDVAADVLEESDGSLLVFGTVSGFLGYSTFDFQRNNANYILYKTDNLGNILWNREYGGNKHDLASKIIKHPTGYILLGSSQTVGNTSFDIHLSKLDSNYEITWQKAFGNSYFDYANDIKITDNALYVLGSAATEDRTTDIVVIKCDLNGNLIWKKIIEEDGSQYGGSLLVHDTIIAVVGYGNTFQTQSKEDVLFFRLNTISGKIIKFNQDSDFQTSEIQIYPNPVEDMLYLRIPETKNGQKNKISLINIAGRTVFEFDTYLNYLMIDVNEYASGIYFLTSSNEQGEISTNKLIIR